MVMAQCLVSAAALSLRLSHRLPIPGLSQILLTKHLTHVSADKSSRQLDQQIFLQTEVHSAALEMQKRRS